MKEQEQIQFFTPSPRNKLTKVEENPQTPIERRNSNVNNFLRIFFFYIFQDAISISLQQSPQKENNIIISSPLDGGNVSDRLAKIQTASLGWKSRVGM